MSLLDLIRAPKSRVFRRAFVKRRKKSDGLFESDWQEITSDVIRWGSIKQEVDPIRPNIFRLSGFSLQMANDEGRYNPPEGSGSLWTGFLNQQRTLVKIEAGFLQSTLSGGIWTNTEFPTSTVSVFVGVISGDIGLGDRNVVNLPIKPLNQIFRDFPASQINNIPNAGFTASAFIEHLRDLTSGAGSGLYIFRPYITSTAWSIQTTTVLYSDLNTTTADNVRDKTTWEVIQALAESENFVPVIDRDGAFNFSGRDPTSTVSFHFFGAGTHDTEYGHTIKSVGSYADKVSSYYSRVQLKFDKEDAVTSFVTSENDFTISSSNRTWEFGHRQLDITNTFVPDSATGLAITANLLTDLGRVVKHIEFKTTFVPHLELLDRVKISYDSEARSPTSRWDIMYWADDPTGEEDHFWDKGLGDAIVLDGDEFKLLSIKLDLDKLECDFIAREIV